MKEKVIANFKMYSINYGWTSSILTFLFILLAVSSLLNEDGDVMLCSAPFFVQLKSMLKDFFSSNEDEEDEEDEEDDEDEDEYDEEEDDDDDDEEEDDDEEDDEEAREERYRRGEKEALEKYRRGEALTFKDKLYLENIQLEGEIEQLKRETEEMNRARKEQRKQQILNAGKAVAKGVVKGVAFAVGADGTPSNSSNSASNYNRTRKVWTMEYVGSGRSDAPSILNVPSENQTGRPTGREITAALESMGYDSGTASSLANGGSENTWKVVG